MVTRMRMGKTRGRKVLHVSINPNWSASHHHSRLPYGNTSQSAVIGHTPCHDSFGNSLFIPSRMFRTRDALLKLKKRCISTPIPCCRRLYCDIFKLLTESACWETLGGHHLAATPWRSRLPLKGCQKCCYEHFRNVHLVWIRPLAAWSFR